MAAKSVKGKSARGKVTSGRLREAAAEQALAESEYATSLLRQLTMYEQTNPFLTLEDSGEKGWAPVGGVDAQGKLLAEIRDPAIARSQSYRFWRLHPQGRGILRNFVRFIIGRQFKIDFDDQQYGKWNDERTKIVASNNEDDVLMTKLAWTEFELRNQFTNRRKEIILRTFRDGEAIIRKFVVNGRVLIRFIEPEKMTTTKTEGVVLETDVDPKDPIMPFYIGKATKIELGVEYVATDRETVIAYHFGDERVPAKEIIHTKPFADSNDLRGITLLEVVAKTLVNYEQWEHYRIVLNKIRTAVALVRKVEGTAQQARSIIEGRTPTRAPISGKVPQTPAGMREAMFNAGTILTPGPGVTYDFMSPKLDARDAGEDGRRILLSASAGVGLPEMLVTGDWCHAEGTEVLTRRGWSDFASLSKSDELATVNPKTGGMEYQRHKGVVSFARSDEMLVADGTKIRFSVTPKHEMWVARHDIGINWTRQPERGKYQFQKVKASDLSRRFYAMQSSVLVPERPPVGTYRLPDGRVVPMSAWLAFLGYFISEGHVLKSSNYKTFVKRGISGGRLWKGLQIVQKKGPVADKIIASLDALGIEYHQSESLWRAKPWYKLGYAWKIYDRKFTEHVAEVVAGRDGGVMAWDKRIPEFAFEAGTDEQRVLLDALVDGDGTRSKSGGMIYGTTSEGLADDVQRLALLLGFLTSKVAAAKRRDYYKQGWRVGISTPHPRLLETSRLKREHYEGLVWCATVPNGLLVTRYEGKVLVSGNSNSNYSSSVEGRTPAVREWEDWQDFFDPVFKQIVAWVIDAAVEFLGLPEKTLRTCELNWPILISKDAAKETARNMNLRNGGIMSLETWASREELVYDDELEKMRNEAEDMLMSPEFAAVADQVRLSFITQAPGSKGVTGGAPPTPILPNEVTGAAASHPGPTIEAKNIVLKSLKDLNESLDEVEDEDVRAALRQYIFGIARAIKV